MTAPELIKWDGNGDLGQVIDDYFKLPESGLIDTSRCCNFPAIMQIFYESQNQTQDIDSQVRRFRVSTYQHVMADNRTIKVVRNGSVAYRLIAAVRKRNTWHAPDLVRIYDSDGADIRLPGTIFDGAVWSLSDTNVAFMLYYARLDGADTTLESDDTTHGDVLKDGVSGPSQRDTAEFSTADGSSSGRSPKRRRT